MRNILVITALAATCSAVAFADQPEPPPSAQQQPNYGCPGPEYQKFKFWVGEWNVTTTNGGKQAGESKVEVLDAGCVIFENWKGASGGSGHSINVYDHGIRHGSTRPAIRSTTSAPGRAASWSSAPTTSPRRKSKT